MDDQFKEALAKMEKPGTVNVSLTQAQRVNDDEAVQALQVQLQSLKKQGHAIVVDETFDDLKRSLGIRVFHYLNCSICQKGVTP